MLSLVNAKAPNQCNFREKKNVYCREILVQKVRKKCWAIFNNAKTIMIFLNLLEECCKGRTLRYLHLVGEFLSCLHFFRILAHNREGGVDVALWVVVAESSGLPETSSADLNSTAVNNFFRLAISLLSYHLVVHRAVVEAGVWNNKKSWY